MNTSKTRTRTRAAVEAAMALIVYAARGQSWQTADEFQYEPGYVSWAFGSTVDPSGSIFVCGGAMDSSGAGHALVRTSGDAGLTWSTIDDFTSGAFSFDHPGNSWGIVSDAIGNLYVVGGRYTVAGQTTGEHWFVRRSQDGGTTWSTVEDSTIGGRAAEARAVAVDQIGTVYVVGTGWNQNFENSWITRQGRAGTNGSISWTTVDQISSGNGMAWKILCHPTAGVFVIGETNGVVIVRRSTNSGASWTTADVPGWSGNTSSSAIGADVAGNIYVTRSAGGLGGDGAFRVSRDGGSSWTTLSFSTNGSGDGFASDSRGSLFIVGEDGAVPGPWAVWENSAGSGTWQNVDRFQYVVGQASFPRAVVSDAAGNIFVAGYNLCGGCSTWLVRKLAQGAPPPRFQSVTQTADGITFKWNAIPGRNYQLQYSTDLTKGNWTDFGTSAAATNTFATASDMIGPERQRFYRVSLLP